MSLIIVCNCSEHQRLVIVNNSDEEIILFHNGQSFLIDSLRYIYCSIHPSLISSKEYNDIIQLTATPPHSSKNIDYWGDYISMDMDTMFLGVFNRIEWDTMSYGEFYSKYPIKHEFAVTVQDMSDCDWTLFYPPNE